MIKAIVFDWHGVIDRTKLESLITQLTTISGKNETEIKDIIKPFERAYARGDSDPSVFWQEVQNALKLSGKDLLTAKESILVVRPYEPLWKRLPDLHDKYKLAILSDCPQDKADIIRKSSDLSFFDVIHFSCEKHKLKDSDDFFLNLLKELGEESQNCLYVDDNQKHIVTSDRLGFRTCHFINIDSLNKYLKIKVIPILTLMGSLKTKKKYNKKKIHEVVGKMLGERHARLSHETEHTM